MSFGNFAIYWVPLISQFVTILLILWGSLSFMPPLQCDYSTDGLPLLKVCYHFAYSMGISELPCPPLDEEALFMPMSFDLSHFFDDVEDDGGIKMEKQNSCQPEIEPKFNERPKSIVDGADYELKLESTKRKLRESYEAAAAKRRAIQIIDFQFTPKQVKCSKTSRPRARTARTGNIIRRSIRQN